MSNREAIIEAFRTLLSNWNKPQLKERWHIEVNQILLKQYPHAFIEENEGWIGMKIDIQSIESIKQVAELAKQFEARYEYHTEDPCILWFKEDGR